MTNLKPFNLERALAGDPVVTREDEYDVTELFCFKTINDRRPLIGAVNGEFYYMHANGMLRSDGKESPHDFMMKPKTKKLWIAVERRQLVDGCHSSTNSYFDKGQIPSSYMNDDNWQKIQIEIEVD